MSEGVDPGIFTKHEGTYKPTDNSELRIFMKDFLLSYGITPQEHIDDNYKSIKERMIERCSDLGLELDVEDDKEIAMVFMTAPKKGAPIAVDTHGLLIKHRNEYRNENWFYLLVNRGTEHYYIKAPFSQSEQEIITEDNKILLFPEGYNAHTQLAIGMKVSDRLSIGIMDVIEKSAKIVDES